MNSVYLCIAELPPFLDCYPPEPSDGALAELVVASTRGRAKALAQRTVKLEPIEFTDWRLQKIGETNEPEGILPHNSDWWSRA